MSIKVLTAMWQPPRRFDVFTGTGRRRSFTAAAIWLLAQGHTVGATSKVRAFGTRWVEQSMERYNVSGPEALANGRRRNGLKRRGAKVDALLSPVPPRGSIPSGAFSRARRHGPPASLNRPGGVQLQPDIQYVINPAGGYVNRAGRLSGDALVLGLRTTITF